MSESPKRPDIWSDTPCGQCGKPCSDLWVGSVSTDEEEGWGLVTIHACSKECFERQGQKAWDQARSEQCP